MVDMSQTIAPKSDQMNADDLIGGPRTIMVTRVSGNEGNAEQPVNVFFNGDDGKPFRPCKSMRRVMVKVWGADASKYSGRAMTLYRDPKVKWGGMEVGGIRISHMTGLEKPETMALTETRSARKPYTVQPLRVEGSSNTNSDPAKEAADKIIANIGRAPDAAKLDAYLDGKPAATIDVWRTDRPDLAAAIDTAAQTKRDSFTIGDDDPFAEPATDAVPGHLAIEQQINHLLAAASDQAGVEAAEAYFTEHRAELPEEVAAEIDTRLSKARREFAA